MENIFIRQWFLCGEGTALSYLCGEIIHTEVSIQHQGYYEVVLWNLVCFNFHMGTGEKKTT